MAVPVGLTRPWVGDGVGVGDGGRVGDRRRSTTEALPWVGWAAVDEAMTTSAVAWTKDGARVVPVLVWYWVSPL